jgi:predicted nucleotidyltransferase component of viral defense system
MRLPINLPVHRAYEFSLPQLPVPAAEEAIAEKLAAWRRRRKMRDLYDLFWFGQGRLDEALIRHVFVLKVWHDVVRDGLGSAPLNKGEVVDNIDLARIPHEEIGLLTQPVEPKKWLEFVCDRYAFIDDRNNDEERVARCSRAEEFFVSQLVASLTPERHIEVRGCNG